MKPKPTRVAHTLFTCLVLIVGFLLVDLSTSNAQCDCSQVGKAPFAPQRVAMRGCQDTTSSGPEVTSTKVRTITAQNLDRHVYLPIILKQSPYNDLLIESFYITQCSMSEANATVSSTLDHYTPGYGAVNEWRIGNGRADSVNPGTSAIGMVGLLYGYNRINGHVTNVPGLDFNDVSQRAKDALRSFFWNWITNPQNQIKDGNNIGFPDLIRYNADGSLQEKSGTANVGKTAEILIAMNKYRQLSPNNDRNAYQSQMYSVAHYMAQYIASQETENSWTIDRSYMVAAFHGFGHWATAVGDTATANWSHGEANKISDWLGRAQDTTVCKDFGNYYNYLDAGGHGVYSGGNIDQTGFAPYEFNARDPGEPFAIRVAYFWDTCTYQGIYLTVQDGRYQGGVHLHVPSDPDRVYPGVSFQLADADWKIAGASGRNEILNWAWRHYYFALSPINSTSGSGCWVNNGSVDGIPGGFRDWVNIKNNTYPPNNWERFVDTSAYMIIATEELVFNSAVTWTD